MTNFRVRGTTEWELDVEAFDEAELKQVLEYNLSVLIPDKYNEEVWKSVRIIDLIDENTTVEDVDLDISEDEGPDPDMAYDSWRDHQEEDKDLRRREDESEEKK